MHDGILAPVGLYAGNLTDVIALANRTVYFLHAGRIASAFTSVTLEVDVTTAYVAGGVGTYAEIGFATGTFVAGGGAVDMTMRGTKDVAAVYNAVGIKRDTVTVSGLTPGDDAWLVYGCRSTGTRYQLRGVLADTIQSGVVRLAGLSQPSTWVAGTGVSIAGAAIVPAWIRGVV